MPLFASVADCEQHSISKLTRVCLKDEAGVLGKLVIISDDFSRTR